MRRFRAFFIRLRALFRSQHDDRDFSAELDSHLQLHVDDNLRAGMTPQEARRQALITLGGLEPTRQLYRERRTLPFLETLLQDLRYAARSLRKNPGFTAIAVLTLALGIGANTAIFSLIDAVLLRSLPVRDPQRLVVFQWAAHRSPNLKGHYNYMSCPAASTGSTGEHGCWFSYPMFRKFQSLQDAFSGVTALCGDTGLNLRGNGPAAFVEAEMVSGDFFDTLGVTPALGRTLAPRDDTPGAAAVAVLSYSYWQGAFGGNPAVVGRVIYLNEIPVTIVGVAAKDFPGLNPARVRAIWLPLSVSAQVGMDLFGSISGDHPSLKAGDDIWWIYAVARLKPGISLGQAQAEANAIFHNDVLDQAKKFFTSDDAPRLLLMPAPQAMSALRERFSTPLAILMAAVAMVLLVACANVAGLMLARSATRQREVAVRLAMGAGRARIVRQLLTESVLLSATGGASGVLLAYWSTQSLVTFMSHGGLWPSHLTARLDPLVLSFTAAASVLTGILCGLAPALRGTRLDLTPALKQSPAALSTTSSPNRWWSLSNGLVIAQVALAILALSGAGLLVRTLQNLKGVNPGFATRNLLIFEMDPSLNGYSAAKSKDLYSDLLARLESIPGVISATYSFDSLLSGNYWDTSFQIEGETQNTHATFGLNAGPKFFATMEIPLLTGRVFTPQDFSLSPDSQWKPAVINEAFARSFFKDQNPLGRRISGIGHQGTTHEIVGIVGDTKFQALRSEIGPILFIPAGGGEAVFEVRTARDPNTIIPAVRSAVSQLDNNLPLFSIKTQSAQIEASLFQERLIARLSAFFAGLALLLACVGLYGLLSHEVARQTREIGVRMALGAQPQKVLWSIILRGIGLSAAGAILGTVAALGATHYIASLLYGVHPFDPLTFTAVALLLGGVGLAACWIPARRAVSIDPASALRWE